MSNFDTIEKPRSIIANCSAINGTVLQKYVSDTGCELHDFKKKNASNAKQTINNNHKANHVALIGGGMSSEREVSYMSCNGAPMVKLGVIFTALVDKGKVLESVFEAESLQFSHLVFIDDDRSNLDSVEEFCLKNDIEFRGVHYRASENIKRPALSEDKERLRFKILEEQKIWLDDTELESYIAKTYDLQ